MSSARSWFLGLAVCVPQICHAADGVAVQHAERLTALSVSARSGATKQIAAKTRAAEPAELRFNAFGRDFVLELDPNTRLAPLESRLALPAGVAAYRGRLAGNDGSWARIVLTPTGPAGIVFDGETLYGIERPADTAVADATGASIFRLDDVYVAPGTMTCATAEPIDGAHALTAMLIELAPLTAGPTLNLDLGAVADYEFFTSFGSDTETALLTRFNNVDGIFSEQLGVQITVATVDVFDTDTDPFTTTNASDLLDEVAEYRGATPAQESMGLTHLFTGRNLDGGIAGIAFIGSVCSQRSFFDSRSFGAGLTEGRRGATLDSLIAAHEIGHNFGAPHDAEAGSPCETTPATFLMASSITGSDQFSACSIEQMQPEIASARCLTPIGAADVAVSVGSPSVIVAAGVRFDYTVTVANVGVDQATGVHVTATTASGLELLGATAGSASCTVALGVDCALGAIDGGTQQAVTLNLRAGQAGTFAVAASVSADTDDDASNDDVGATVTATNPVDLVVRGAASSIEIDQPATIDVAIDNVADFAATAVGVTLTLTGGLRPDQATAAGSSCSVAGQTVTCPPLEVAAHASVPITLTVAATAVGNQQVSVTATSAEVDTSPADNQLAIVVSVGPPADDGGTGAMSWLALLGLLGAASAARRKRIS